MPFTEADAVLPALRIISKNPGCGTDFLIEQIPNEYVLKPEDMTPLTNRRDLRYTQIIRNLVSHRRNDNLFSQFIRFDLDPRTNQYRFTLTDAGREFLQQRELDRAIENIDEGKEDERVAGLPFEPYIKLEELEMANNRTPTLNGGNIEGPNYPTEPRIAHTALENCNFCCEYALLVGEQHTTFQASSGHLYLEAHHLIPMKAQIDFPNQNLDRTENIVGLCPNCHRAVHYGTLQEKMQYLRILYDSRIETLQNCDHHIDISFEDLINKYYL